MTKLKKLAYKVFELNYAYKNVYIISSQFLEEKKEEDTTLLNHVTALL